MLKFKNIVTTRLGALKKTLKPASGVVNPTTVEARLELLEANFKKYEHEYFTSNKIEEADAKYGRIEEKYCTLYIRVKKLLYPVRVTQQVRINRQTKIRLDIQRFATTTPAIGWR